MRPDVPVGAGGARHGDARVAMRAAREAMRKIDPKAEVCAYMDDTYFIGTPAAVEAGRAAYERVLLIGGESSAQRSAQ